MDNTTGSMPNADAVAARKAALAEALRTGQPTIVTPSGQVESASDAEARGQTGIVVPEGKLA